jgi:pilus assembly protein CpaF
VSAPAQHQHFNLILPYIPELRELLADVDVTEVMVNPDGKVWYERDGKLYGLSNTEIPEQRRQAGVKVIARLLGQDISEEESPLLDARLPDGSRVSAVYPPISVGGTSITIRKFRHQYFTALELVNRKMLTMEQLNVITDAIADRQNILISGATGSGKSTLLAALTAYMPPENRVVLIEDTAELSLQGVYNLVRLEARKKAEGVKEITMRDLVKQSLRMRPDRIIMGEVRGAEAFDLISALQTGHMGSFCTVHANSAAHALPRLRTLVAMAGETVPDKAMASMIAGSINLIVHVSREHDGARKVQEIATVFRYDSDEDEFYTEAIE